MKWKICVMPLRRVIIRLQGYLMRKRAQREHKPSRIEQMMEDMLKEEEIKRKRKKGLEELTNNINKEFIYIPGLTRFIAPFAWQKVALFLH